MSIHIDSVTFEHNRIALGIAQDRPRISWRFTGNAKDWVQREYEIEVFRMEKKENFRVPSEDSLLVPWPSTPLQPGESVTIRVCAYGGIAEDEEATLAPWSEPVNVEMGLKPSDWTASLIEPTQVVMVSESKRPIMFRRQFRLKQAISRARLYITAHGVYAAEINGQPVGDHVFAPGWTSYGHRLTYQTFDVTHLLKPGDNGFGAYAGPGWYHGRLGFGGGKAGLWGDNIGLFAELIVYYIDGSHDTIVTDHDWKWSVGPIIFSEIYDGEEYDARLELKGWSTSKFDDNRWAKVSAKEMNQKERLQPPDAPPVRRTQELKAKEIIKSPSGKTIVDFGQNFVGWLRVTTEGQEGHSISFTHTEVLENGEIATRPLRHAKAKDTITLSNAKLLTWEPKFTFHGFRYVQVDNWPSRNLELSDLTGIVLHTDMQRTGWFECSNELLNQLHKNVTWGMRGNFLSIPTDCPQRDERLGWTGDLCIFASTANYLYDTCGMLESWLKDVAEEQMEDGGCIPPLVTPDVLRTPRWPQAIWGDVVVSAPWDLYEAFGDEETLSRQYGSMKSWLDHGIPRDDRGLWDRSLFQLGDWLDPKAPSDEPGNSVTDSQYVANAHLIKSTDLMVKISSILGFQDDMKKYQESARKLRAAFARAYITESGRVVSDSQTAIALAIQFSLFPSSAQEHEATDRLKLLILQNSRFKIATGFAGTPVIGHALTKMGETQLFYRMLLHKKCPSWLYPVTMGATTVWERWDSMLPDGSINPGEMTSFNHYALGAVADWMHKVIGGISPSRSGWKKCLIQPIPGGALTSCTTSHLSPYGMMKATWRIEGEEFVLDISVPPNTTADVVLPGAAAVETVGSGEYSYRVKYNAPAWPPLPIYFPFAPHDDDEP